MFQPEGSSVRRMTERQVKELYSDSGMEVAVHGLTHPGLAHLSQARCSYVVIKDRENLEKLFHTVIRGISHHGDPLRGEEDKYHGSKTFKDSTHSIDHIIALGEEFKVMQYRIVEDQDALDATDHSPVYVDIGCIGCE